MIDLPEDESPPLLQLLALSVEAGAYSLPPEHRDALVDAAAGLQFVHRAIDLAGCGDKDTLFARIAHALAFPDWFGGNWDALADCLSDLEWLGHPDGFALLFEHAQDLRLASLDDYDALIELLDDVAAGWREVDVPFWSFLCESPQPADDPQGDA
jgi:RNAse (barnase) inhibitor barstar